jgi:hypothetical protein
MRDTRDMARESGLIVDANQSGFDAVLAFEALVRADAIADEREACAKVCESTAPSQINGYECAAVIRSRSSEH